MMYRRLATRKNNHLLLCKKTASKLSAQQKQQQQRSFQSLDGADHAATTTTSTTNNNNQNTSSINNNNNKLSDDFLSFLNDANHNNSSNHHSILSNHHSGETNDHAYQDLSSSSSFSSSSLFNNSNNNNTSEFHQAMSDLFSHFSQKGDATQEQLRLEQQSVQDTALRYQKTVSGATQRAQGASLPPARRVIMEWFDPLVEEIKQKQRLFLSFSKGQSKQQHDASSSSTPTTTTSTDMSDNEKSSFFNPSSSVMSGELSFVGPYISLLTAEELAVIVIHSTLSSTLKAGRVLASTAAASVGRAVCAQVNIMKLKKAKCAHVLSYLPRDSQFIQSVNHMTNFMLPDENSNWGTETTIQVGGFLLHLLLNVAAVPVKKTESLSNDILADLFASTSSNLENNGEQSTENATSNNLQSALDAILADYSTNNPFSSKDNSQDSSAGNRVKLEPAFKHDLEYTSGKSYGVIVIHESLTDIVNEAHSLLEIVEPALLPMVVQPKPWVGSKNGGYLSVINSIMRTNGSRMQSIVLQDAPLQDIFEGLNVLNDTQWSINAKVYDVILKVWAAGAGIAALPRRRDEPLPDKPAVIMQENSDALTEESIAQIRAWKKQFGSVKQGNQDLHSLRCDMLYKLKVARDFKDRSFYFPHNVDFRGRAYPIPPHLNHLGSDVNRGLLLFSKVRPIGERGIFWLKIHLANLYGKDKYSLAERIKFVDDNIDNIFRSADEPLPGLNVNASFMDDVTTFNRTTTDNDTIHTLRTDECWWLQSENPWQTLAACIELTNCLRSPNPAAYESGLPIQMDGSCNGLQHYAALGRDNLGALHVNLLPTDKPMDVYLGVLEVVKKHIDQDAAKGDELALLLQGNVYRSTIKQTVMTSVYGVTFVGAREQIQRRLKEKKDLPEDKIGAASIYLARVTLHSLGEVFQSARTIMDWLNELAHVVSSKNQPVVWITPLGLPVVQPYRSGRKTSVKTVLQNFNLISSNDDLPVSRARQKSAFPPNYVHSLDACHMFMTAKTCKKNEIEFASVHDSFWTHAGDVDHMNDIIRDEFINLHSQPLLETLLTSMQELHPDLEFPPIPKRGHLQLERVRKSKYFFD